MYWWIVDTDTDKAHFLRVNEILISFVDITLKESIFVETTDMFSNTHMKPARHKTT